MKYSQLGQDEWVIKKLKGKKNGFFVDIAAYDGVELSNTYLLESQYDWNGICLECNPLVIYDLMNNRDCYICDRPIWTLNDKKFYLKLPESEKDWMLSFITKKKGGIPLKPSINIMSLLTMYKAPKEIDYISLDIEGIESHILSTFDFKAYNVKCWTIEHNNVQDNYDHIYKILNDNGYDIEKCEWDLFAYKDCF